MLHRGKYTMTKFISLHSYKGGTGKTMISVNLSLDLSKEQKVLLIESDFWMPCFSHIFTAQKPQNYYNDFYNLEEIGFEKYITSTGKKNLDVIYASPEYDPKDKVFSMDYKFHIEKLKKLMKTLNTYKDTYDYIIFDTAPGRNFPALTNLLISEYFFIIVRPNLYSVLGTKNMIEETYTKTKPSSQFHSVVIFNQVPDPESKEMTEKLEEWSEALPKTIEKYLTIPYDMEMAVETTLGKFFFTEGILNEKVLEMKEYLNKTTTK